MAEPVRTYRLTAEDPESAVARGLVEHRRHPRRLASWRVRLWIGEDAFDGHAVDVSIYGIRVVTSAKDFLKVGEWYHVEILADENNPLQYQAVVRNLDEHGVRMEAKEPFPLV